MSGLEDLAMFIVVMAFVFWGSLFAAVALYKSVKTDSPELLEDDDEEGDKDE